MNTSHLVMGWSWETNPDVVEMASCRFGGGCWRPLCMYGRSGPSRAARWAGVWSALAALEKGKETFCEVFSQDRVQQRLVKKITEVHKGPVEQFFKLPEPQMAGQSVDVPEIVVVLAVSSGEAGSSWPGGRDTTDAATAAVEEPVGESRLSRGSQNTVLRQSRKSKCLLGKLGRLGYRARSTPSAVDTAVAKPADEVRPPGVEETVEAVTPVQSCVNECNRGLSEQAVTRVPQRELKYRS